MLGSLFQNFLSAPQGQQAMTQLQSQGYPPGQAQGLLQSAFPAAAQAMQRAMPGGSAAAASPDAPASLTDIGGSLVSGRYPYVAGLVDPWEVFSLEFLEPQHPVYALRPADPLQILWGFYSPNASFCYPGGETTL